MLQQVEEVFIIVKKRLILNQKLFHYDIPIMLERDNYG